MQRIKDLFEDDSAVSPVIGVILMVAITVILAAVIASFVLGLGDQTDDVSPNIQFSSDYNVENGSNSTTVTIQTADNDVDADNIYVRGDMISNTTATWTDFGGTDITAGDSIEVTESNAGSYGGGDELVIVFETESTTDTLATFTFPDG